jgi:hypothetical protein
MTIPDSIRDLAESTVPLEEQVRRERAGGWQPIETAPRDGTEVLVFVDCATVRIIRLAWWDDGSLWDHHGAESPEADRGWWSYDTSVTQTKLEGATAPTHWMPAPEPPPEPAQEGER